MSKIIIITGASSGIGKATALQLLEEGHTVYGGARRVEKMEDIVKAGGKALPLDVTDKDSIQNFVKEVIEKEGRIDVLFNNAGYGLYGAVEDIPIEQARRQFEVNLFGLAEMTKQVLPHMRKQKSGKIINTSSMGGKIYMPLGAWYHGVKHALEGWSDSLRLDLKSFNIDVVIIEPGAIATEFGDVTSQNLKNVSENGTGAYKELTETMAKAIKKTYDEGDNSPASVIAKTVSKAIKAKKPKTRYAAGKYAKLTLFVRRYFSDRFFDWMVMKMVK